MQRNREKIKSLAHYVISQCPNPEVLGSIKLNKVLWVSDLWAYVARGEPITGEHYIKRQFGPVVASMVGILDELKVEERIAVRQAPRGGKVDYFALTEPDLSLFTAEEISLVDDAIRFVCLEHSANEISERTHDIIWKLAEIGEGIPLHAMLASELGEVTPEDVEWAKNIAA